LFVLQRDDIDWLNRQIHVRRTYKHRRFYEPTSKASILKIDLAPELVKALKEWKLACLMGELNLVFPTGIGTLEDANNMLKR
jgi:integrase